MPPLFALVTPFEKNGAINFSALGDYLDFLSGHGVARIITNGTTGEFASLTRKERMAVLEYCRPRFKGEIINHAGACAVEDCQIFLRHSGDFADAVLLLPLRNAIKPWRRSWRSTWAEMAWPSGS